MFKFFVPMLLLASVSAFATTGSGISGCASASLSSYVNSYAPPSLGCAIGILDYSNFSYVPMSNAPLASDILVSPTNQGFGFTRVDNTPFVASGNIVKFAIYYNIFIDPAPVIVGADDSLDPPVGNVSITELFCNDAVLYPGTTSCFPPSSTAYSLTVTTASPTASITFKTPAFAFQTVGIFFTLDGTNGLASFDGLNSNTQVTPEPASALLVGLFIFAGGYKLRKQRQH